MPFDQSKHSARSDRYQDAESEIETAVGHIERAISDMRKQRGTMTSDAIDDAMNAMIDIASELKGECSKLQLRHNGEAA